MAEPIPHRMNTFSSPDALAEALANRCAEALRTAIKARGAASIAVSGGSTPGRFFEALSRKELDWTRVIVTLVDERFVPPSSERSNERLVRERLLTNEARLARFVALYSAVDTAETAAAQSEAGLALLGPNLDIVVLGMGTDGHTASYFPDADEFEAALDPDQRRRVLAIHAPSAVEPRLTLTLPTVVGARFLALHIEGREKQRLLQRAVESDQTLPIARVMAAAGRPVDVFWAPNEG